MPKRDSAYVLDVDQNINSACLNPTNVPGGPAGGTKDTAPILNDMKYRDIEYTVVQGIGRHLWKWSVSLDTGVSAGGQAVTRSEAVANAERAIDRALASKKLRLMPKQP